MSLLEKLEAKRRERKEFNKKIDEKNERGFEKNLQLEKGDLLAILIAGFLNFILPIMLVIGAICGLSYLLFSVF